jgi:hypothetical protein
MFLGLPDPHPDPSEVRIQDSGYVPNVTDPQHWFNITKSSEKSQQLRAKQIYRLGTGRLGPVVKKSPLG